MAAGRLLFDAHTHLSMRAPDFYPRPMHHVDALLHLQREHGIGSSAVYSPMVVSQAIAAGRDPLDAARQYNDFIARNLSIGNTFTVIRQNDPSTFGGSVDPSEEVNSNLPLDDIATCLAVDVREHATTCLLVRSVREVLEGDRVLMSAGAVADGSASH